MPSYKQSGAYQRRGAVSHRLRSLLARGDGDLPLPEPLKDAIFALENVRNLANVG
jgi:hypothetical protein